MKRLIACLALCASLSASAQDDNCTVLGVQELSSLYAELSASIDTIVAALESATLSDQQSKTIEEYDQVYVRNKVHVHDNIHIYGGNGWPSSQEYINPSIDTVLTRLENGWNLLDQECSEIVEGSYYFYNPGASGQYIKYRHCNMLLTFVKYADD